MKKYQAPTKEFFRLPNNIFDLKLDLIQFMLYAYLVSCAGSKGYCWPSQKTIAARTGIGATSVQDHLKVLAKRQMVSISKHRNAGSHPNNEHTLLSLDNPEVYRDLKTADEELPLFVGDDFPI